jgi:undecaprenyl phosphate-alpha-L-ara4N flippase subunit ArnF
MAAFVWVVSGVVCYIVAMLVWLQVLRLLPLSVAYPLLSLGYIVVYLAAYFLPEISEAFTYQKSVGIGLIMLGVILVTSKPKDAASEQ